MSGETGAVWDGYGGRPLARRGQTVFVSHQKTSQSGMLKSERASIAIKSALRYAHQMPGVLRRSESRRNRADIPKGPATPLPRLGRGAPLPPSQMLKALVRRFGRGFSRRCYAAVADFSGTNG
ncbi:hypothetical protein SKAU_G00309820 [Synaphobranchus kaupii]|uniref:Uncharacterized protein n=1 Tax=Synaphobranchus kaupii TaxID=118154 RepID=A0A9Q1ERM1_SYNKA|nr:hypothetical protein SKAU_G00309820 [Synaphobranchus kaupii]